MLDVNEIIIPVPWGHISAKTWGSNINPPILVVHGRQDNAGSFDLLIPKLSHDFYYVCIDLPSHGKSSHFPPYVPLHLELFVIAIKYVIEYFQWRKITVIAHSLGGRVMHTVSLIYPWLFDGFISLDSLTTQPVDPRFFGETARQDVKNLMQINRKLMTRDPPEYSYEEALERIQAGRITVICREGAVNLLKRSIVPTERGTFRLTTDQRLKAIFYNPVSPRNLAQIITAARHTFPHLVLIASETNDLNLMGRYTAVLKALEKNKNFQLKIVKGNHDVHNNSPDTVSLLINKFLAKKVYISKL